MLCILYILWYYKYAVYLMKNVGLFFFTNKNMKSVVYICIHPLELILCRTTGCCR